MRVLYIGFSQQERRKVLIEGTFSDLDRSAPFGYDVIVVNPVSLASLVSTQYEVVDAISKWRELLPIWMGGHHRLVVLQQPYNQFNQEYDNYSWLNLDGIKPHLFEACGTNDYIGDIRAQDPYVKNILRTNLDKFEAHSYFRPGLDMELQVVNAQVEERLYTSFSWKHENQEVIFLPYTDLITINKFVALLGDGSTLWKIHQATDLERKINEIDSRIAVLESEKNTVAEELHRVNDSVKQLLATDLYLERAVASFELTQSVENPNPENFYEAVEAIEKAFSSEREMRDTLDISKAFVDKVMKRANEFRHVAKTGKKPDELSEDEISDFTKRVSEIISKYLQYLYEEDQKI